MSIALTAGPRQPSSLFMLQVNCFFPFPTSFFILFLWLLPHPPSSVQLTLTVSSVCTCSASFFPLMVLPPSPFSIYAEGQAGKSGLAKGQKAESWQVAAFWGDGVSCLFRNVSGILFELKQSTFSISCCGNAAPATVAAVGGGLKRMSAALLSSTAFHVCTYAVMI